MVILPNNVRLDMRITDNKMGGFHRPQIKFARSCYNMLKFKLLFGNNKLEFTDIDVALRSALALSENFNVHMIVYNDDEVVKIVMIKEEREVKC